MKWIKRAIAVSEAPPKGRAAEQREEAAMVGGQGPKKGADQGGSEARAGQSGSEALKQDGSGARKKAAERGGATQGPALEDPVSHSMVRARIPSGVAETGEVGQPPSSQGALPGARKSSGMQRGVWVNPIAPGASGQVRGRKTDGSGGLPRKPESTGQKSSGQVQRKPTAQPSRQGEAPAQPSRAADGASRSARQSVWVADAVAARPALGSAEETLAVQNVPDQRLPSQNLQGQSRSGGTAEGAAAVPADLPPPPPLGLEDDGDWGLDDVFMQLESGALPEGALADESLDGEAEAEANGALFLEMVVHHARPLREFMLGLSMAPATRDWLEIVRPLVQNLAKGAEALAQQSLAQGLLAFDRALGEALAVPGQKVGGAVREALLAAYQPLAEQLPDAFDVREARELREPLLVHYLLRQVPGVYKITIDKLYAAGLGTLGALSEASTDDLMALGRLDRVRAQGIVNQFKEYRREQLGLPPELEEARSQVQSRLKVLLTDLERAQQAFVVAEANDNRIAKRLARSQKQEMSSAIAVALVQLGEVDMVELLERSSTEHKLAALQRYLEAPKGAAVGGA